ncbi:MAG TPA: nidogen-like domain-containing protein [Bacteroidia bacterium]|nr:nidogen-like domain-containing protein [Bacteroidia bacterium]
MIRKIFPAVFLFAALPVNETFAQQPAVGFPNPGSTEYQQLKKEGRLSGSPLIIVNSDTTVFPFQQRIDNNPSPASVICRCIIPLDSTFQVVPFQFSSPPDYRNDDSYSNLLPLPFNFCFYGQPMSNCYINNNGNISFGASYGAFTANAFPDPNFIMIAPFWSDVDTWNLMSGLVYYKMTPTYMVVRWQTVGYFSAHADLLNDFQLIITDGMDPILPAGNNVSFCYGDMQWTTGDASGGTNGFGGSPATVGVNRGNGIDFIQIGQFDAPGTAYDGPFGSADQISWLDNQTFYFNVCNSGSGNNLPPIINSADVCDTIVLCIGDTALITASFLSPEQGQNTTASITGSVTGLTVVSSTTGNPALIVGQLIANFADAGFNTIVITGTDNGSPPATISANVVVHIIGTSAVSFTMSPPPVTPPGTLIQFTDLTPGSTSWFWDFGDGSTSTLQNPTHAYATDSLYTVSLTVLVGNGCSATLTQVYLVESEILWPEVTAPNVVTPGSDGKNDFLEFVNLTAYNDCQLKIYDRWGALVYETGNYRNDWQPNVVDGVYYYLLKVPGKEEQLRGFFHVIHE